jgi:hypothetical protein
MDADLVDAVVLSVSLGILLARDVAYASQVHRRPRSFSQCVSIEVSRVLSQTLRLPEIRRAVGDYALHLDTDPVVFDPGDVVRKFIAPMGPAERAVAKTYLMEHGHEGFVYDLFAPCSLMPKTPESKILGLVSKVAKTLLVDPPREPTTIVDMYAHLRRTTLKKYL